MTPASARIPETSRALQPFRRTISTSAALPRALFNGSIPGYSEFGRDIRGGVEPPKQWVALMTPRWVLRERCDVVLAEPPRANIKPRVRIVDGKMVPA